MGSERGSWWRVFPAEGNDEGRETIKEVVAVGLQERFADREPLMGSPGLFRSHVSSLSNASGPAVQGDGGFSWFSVPVRMWIAEMEVRS